MAVSSKPRLRTFKASGVIRPYRFVKWGATSDLMTECDGNEKPMGIYQGPDTLAANEFGEVALPGGGGLLEAAETIALGKYLTPNADGEGEVADAADEVVGAIAYESAVDGDIFGVEVVHFIATASDA